MNRWVAVGLNVFVIVFVLTYLVLWWFGMHNMLWYTIEGYRCELRPIEQRPNRDFFVSGRSRAAVGKVVTYDNRPNERFVELSCEINRMYCERQGYDYEYFSAVPYEDELPVYWLKVRLVMEEVLAAGPSIDWVMWIDSDAVFNKHEHRVEEFLAPDVDVAMSADPISRFNAGVFVIRTTDYGKAFAKEWMAAYDPAEWRRDANGKWTTAGVWAGPAYEQGAFGALVSSRFKAYNIQRLCPCVAWDLRLQPNLPHAKNFVVHMMGTGADSRVDQFGRLRDHLRNQAEPRPP